MSKNGRQWWSGWLPATGSDLNRIKEILDKIMATQSEIVAQLKDVSQGLKDTQAAVASLQTEVGKVGTETDSLIKQVDDLKAIIDAGGTITQELQDAVADVATQAGAVKSGITNVATAVQAVDDKVPDAPTT